MHPCGYIRFVSHFCLLLPFLELSLNYRGKVLLLFGFAPLLLFRVDEQGINASNENLCFLHNCSFHFMTHLSSLLTKVKVLQEQVPAPRNGRDSLLSEPHADIALSLDKWYQENR